MVQDEQLTPAPVFTVREAHPADAEGITALLSGIYAEQDYFVGAAAAPDSVLQSRLEYRKPDECVYLVAVSRDPAGFESVIGWLELHRQGAARMRHVATLTLAVARRSRRGGVGRSLLRHSYRWCREVGVIKVSLNVRASNAAAVSLYLSEGFELEGRERGAIRVGPLDRLATPATAADYEDNLVMGRFVGGASLDLSHR